MIRHSWRQWILLLIISLIGGCSTLQLTPEESDEIRSFLDSVQTAKQVTDRAQRYREQDGIVKALSLLQKSRGKFPGNEEIRQLDSEYQRIWRLQRLELEMQLLVIESRWLIESLPLLQELVGPQLNNHWINARITLLQYDLDSKEPELVKCGVEMETENIWLAKRCLSMAYRISQRPETMQRLAAVNSRIEEVQRAASKKLAQKEDRRRAQRIDRLLTEAQQESEQGALVNAMAKINEALKQDPESPRVREQLAELQEQTARHVEILMKLGDRLYRNQQIEASIAVWEAALKLDPNQQQVRERIIRARTVLNKLESIRSVTQPSTP